MPRCAPVNSRVSRKALFGNGIFFGHAMHNGLMLLLLLVVLCFVCTLIYKQEQLQIEQIVKRDTTSSSSLSSSGNSRRENAAAGFIDFPRQHRHTTRPTQRTQARVTSEGRKGPAMGFGRNVCRNVCEPFVAVFAV